jgi:ectoine hydroxylase-related dioxygenase (phytanoyl-CoA dioxygenase family)
MPIEHFSSSAKPEHILEALRRDGCAVVDRLTSREQIDRIRGEMAPYIEATAPGADEFAGSETRRTGGLIERSPAARELITNATVLGCVKGLLEGATTFHIHLTQMISIGPGESAQTIHRDQWAFDFFPFPSGYDVQCNTIWAMDDFTEENGATRVVPGSNHREDRLSFKHEDTEPAEMEAGSALIYTGSVYHGGGANQSDAVRSGLNLTYARGWLRQEENQYLTVPPELARTLDEPLQRLMGYSLGAYALGYVDDLRDPLDVLRGEDRAAKSSLGDLQRAAEQVRSDSADA